jgi:hypothetical protein
MTAEPHPISRRVGLALAGLLALACAAVAGAPARADEAAAKPRETRFVAREAGKEAGLETLRVASGESGVYASGQVKKKDSKRPHLTSFLQRDGAGRIVKYRRQLEARQGKGVFAFRHGEGLRVVPINDGGKPVDSPALLKAVVWDPDALHMVATWADRLDAAQASVTLVALDAASRKETTLVATRAGSRTLTGPKGAAVETTQWDVQRAGAAVAKLYVDGGRRVVGAEAGTRSLLVEGLAWAAPGTAAPPEPAGAPTRGEAGAGDKGEPDEGEGIDKEAGEGP